MRFRCRHADVQPASDLLVAEPALDQFGGLALTSGQRRSRDQPIAAGASISSVSDAPEQAGSDPAGADLLATMDIHHQADEIAQRRGSRNVADHPRLRPGDDVVFSLPDRGDDDAHAGSLVESAPCCGCTLGHSSIQQYDIRLHGRTERHRLGEIGAQPDDRHRGVAFEELGKTFAGEAHTPYEQDAYTPTGTARNDSLVRRNVCLHPHPPVPQFYARGHAELGPGPAFRSCGDRSDPRRRQPPGRLFRLVISRPRRCRQEDIIQPCVACPGRYCAIGSIGCSQGRQHAAPRSEADLSQPSEATISR